MKKTYNIPNASVLFLKSEDVITSSPAALTGMGSLIDDLGYFNDNWLE